MKLLIDIGHPAHVHYFKNLAYEVLRQKGSILFTCRNKDVTIELLTQYKLPFISFGRNFKTVPGKIFGLIYFSLRVFLISLKFRPTMFLNASIYSAFVAWCLRKPHISLEDTFNKEQLRLYMPFTTCVLTGDYQHPNLGKKEIRYKGYQELAYLHPSKFQPDKSILNLLEINDGERYVILRFVAWEASHDLGINGIPNTNKLELISILSQYARVFISSECELEGELKQFQISIPADRIHDAIAYSTLMVCESFTMASEAAVLGVPAILLHNSHCFYTYDQEIKYGLVSNFSGSAKDFEKAMIKGRDILSMKDKKNSWEQSRKQLIEEHIDVSDFLYWFVNNFPDSMDIMRENPDYQHNFNKA